MAGSASNISIAILAAGTSSRMGSPKQLLLWRDDILVVHAIKTALNTKTNEVIVVLGANYDAIAEEIKHFPVIILNNKQWELGLGASIACASKYVESQSIKPDGLLVMLADQPLVSTEYLNDMIEVFVPQTNQIVATAYDDQKFGVPVLFDGCYIKQLLVLNDDSGAKQILKTNESLVKVLKLSVKNVDLDTKEDYEKLRKKQSK